VPTKHRVTAAATLTGCNCGIFLFISDEKENKTLKKCFFSMNNYVIIAKMLIFAAHFIYFRFTMERNINRIKVVLAVSEPIRKIRIPS